MPGRQGVNPFTEELCVFKAMPASNTLRALAMKKLKRCSELVWDSCWLNRRQTHVNPGGWSHQDLRRGAPCATHSAVARRPRNVVSP